MPGLVSAAVGHSGKPAVVYPNSGEGWDAEARAWTGTAGVDPERVPAWVAAGARLVGGCCRVRPSDIARLTKMIR